MITDSHCHLGSPRYEAAEWEQIISNARAAGVGRMVTLATSLADISVNLRLAEHPEIRAAIGIHPCDVHTAPDDAVSILANYADDKRVCAIGETGLDYFHETPEGWAESDFRERQREFLRQHFELAAEKSLNIVIHTRDKAGKKSFHDALSIYLPFAKKVRAVFHCFTSDYELAKQVIAAGGLVSFGGVATFKNAPIVQKTVKQCPAGSFMIETDAPYLAPEPRRGKRNEPAFASHVAEAIAAIRCETLDDLSRHTEEVVDGFFRWER